MRPAESEYWDSIAAKVSPDESGFRDNWSKRRLLGQFLLKCSWSGQRVLEIGVGCAATAALLALSCGRNWDYIGTDVSAKFIEVARRFGFQVVQTDVLNLPEGKFTRILALDSLEHVHPDDRKAGYANIASRLVDGGLLFINMPLAESLHKDEFDHGIGVADIVRLESFGLYLNRYERYEMMSFGQYKAYAFVVMGK